MDEALIVIEEPIELVHVGAALRVVLRHYYLLYDFYLIIPIKSFIIKSNSLILLNIRIIFGLGISIIFPLCILFQTIRRISQQKMHHNFQKIRSAYSLKLGKKSCKLQQICSSCTMLKRQVKQLKEIQQKIVKELRQMIAFVPKEIEGVINKLRGYVYNFSQEIPKSKIRPASSMSNYKSNSAKNSPKLKIEYESKLKEEDSLIKESIKKELKAIRVLQSKQIDLRKANEKHEILRKSLSKESLHLNNNVKPVRPIPSARSIQLASPQSPQSLIEKQVWREDVHTGNEAISSPKFGKSHEQSFKFQSPSRYSSQESRSRTRKLSQTKLQYQILKCSNGHEYYKGDTINKIPHGIGTLMNCCTKIPIKVSSKTLKYTGSFKNGQFEGKGILICKDSVKFQGNFSKGMRQGEGTIYLDGSGERGVWDQDKLVSFI